LILHDVMETNKVYGKVARYIWEISGS